MAADTVKDVSGIDVAYVARLARISLTPEEIRTFQPQMSRIVEYINTLKPVDVSAVEPMARAVPLQTVARGDDIRPGLSLAALLGNAPEQDGEQFLVPRIV